MLILLKLLGRICATAPEPLVRAGCICLGRVIGISQPKRRRHILLNLHHAYPEQSERWRRKLYYESCSRTAEMGLFVAASAYFSEARLKRVLDIAPDVQQRINDWFEANKENKRPSVLLLPHVCMAESMILLPGAIPYESKVNVIFRPLNQPKIDAWLGEQRARFGANMLSKRNGFNQAMAALREGETVAVLYDQNASKKGSMITFMDRVCSATDLPGLLVKRFDADVFVAIPERIGLWRARLHLEQLPKPQSVEEVSIAGHQALERHLRSSFNCAADWLWLHMRWDHQFNPKKRFKLSPKKSHLWAQNAYLTRPSIPRKTRLWIRMPNWLGDVVMALPILRAIRKGRPDMEITLIGKAAFKPLFDRLDVGDQFIPLPAKGSGYFRKFYQLRHHYPDTYLLFTNSFRSDLEAFLTRCNQRFGMLRPNKKRPLLTDPYELPASIDETQIHQTKVWEKMLRRYGLAEELDTAALPREQPTGQVPQIGLICGTENSPEKRWPITHWRKLIERTLESQANIEILLYGTPADDAITQQVAEGFPTDRVTNLAGKTNLDEFCDGLKHCHAIVCNDTGGMHLANMLGTPVVAVFGPTNPVRTGPVFDAPAAILQPEGCPQTGGLPIDQVSADTVFKALSQHLN